MLEARSQTVHKCVLNYLSDHNSFTSFVGSRLCATCFYFPFFGVCVGWIPSDKINDSQHISLQIPSASFESFKSHSNSFPPSAPVIATNA